MDSCFHYWLNGKMGIRVDVMEPTNWVDIVVVKLLPTEWAVIFSNTIREKNITPLVTVCFVYNPWITQQGICFQFDLINHLKGLTRFRLHIFFKFRKIK